MKLRVLALALVTALAVSIVAPLHTTPAHAAAPVGAALTVPVNQGTAVGTLTVTSFKVVNGVLTAVGTYSGTTANGTAVTNAAATAPVSTAASSGSCSILHLVLGPINLNLLGLQVTTNQIVLDITAQPGPGNLLGNLLCAVANLLNQGGPASGLAGLLNTLLRHL